MIQEFKNKFGNYGLYQNGGYMGYSDVFDEVVEFIEDEIKKLITDEINIAQREGQPTSRLTNLYNKL